MSFAAGHQPCKADHVAVLPDLSAHSSDLSTKATRLISVRAGIQTQPKKPLLQVSYSEKIGIRYYRTVFNSK